jgi:hypothetical protein
MQRYPGRRSPHVPIRIAGVLVIVVILLGSRALASRLAFAATRAPASTCVETWVYLNGTNPATISCYKTSNTTTSVTTASCSKPANAWIASKDNGTICFFGSGYLGLSGCCTHVYDVDFFEYGGWVFYYYNGSSGQKYYFSAGQDVRNTKPFDGTNNKVTQICIRQPVTGSGC